MARFYTNPFVKDAPMAAAVKYGESRFLGYTLTRDGAMADYGRDVTYSDGTVRVEELESRPTNFGRYPGAFDGTFFVQSKPSPGKWGGRVHYPISPDEIRR